jgi:hypothetical protein
MKTIETKTLGREVKLSVPVNITEALTLGATEERVVQKAVEQELFHVYLGNVRDDVCGKLEASTGVKMLTEPTTKKDGTNGSPKVIESEQKYIDRIIAAEKATQKDVDSLIDSYVSQNAFKFSATGTRTKVDKALNDRLERADKMLADPARLERFQGMCDEAEVEVDSSSREALAESILRFTLAI